MQAAFETIKQLVADFKAQESAYLSPSYQESQIRQDFIDKFFTALGWDVTHTIQKNPYQQEVHIENKVHMAGSQRRADYAFFLSPNFRDPKYFVEAKKPSRNLANPDDYYQTIRYGWNANTPIAILTDFEEFHILDCRYKPNIKDVMNQKIEYFHYSDYANEEKFSRIYWLFSHEAVASGSLEKRVAELPKMKGKAIKGGYQPVDEAFLEELDKYREILAKAFKKSNPDLQSEELTEAVQRTIDRLVFIRFLEDKQIEEPAIINLQSKKSAWMGFLDLCKQMDPKYNGLVFKSHKVLDGKDFIPPDDEEFGTICGEISDPHSPYNFDQIPISILGSIYERFLGKVVHATDKRVKVEEKPEVRKAGGVYYTPEYIVRYIVSETVGKLIEGKTPEEIAKMTFADIACGSGSFLIEVYNQLLDYHIRYYSANPDKQKETDVFEREGKLHLTLKKKKEILINNVYGVDIDFQATEVTQLSLYLKLLEDVTMHDAHQFGMFKETILPDLRKNIINGNSLIRRDIIEGQLFADINENKLKPMNFEDAFPTVMKRGGFDAVVGNPPYIRIQTLKETNPETVEYFNKHYVSAMTGNYDIYVVFVECAQRKLNNKGRVGYILPHKFFNAQYGEGLRGLISKEKTLNKIVSFGDQQIFDGVTTYTCLLFLNKSESTDFEYDQVDNLAKWKQDQICDNKKMSISLIDKSEWNFNQREGGELLKKLHSLPVKLENIADRIYQGLVTGADSVFLMTIVSDGSYYSDATGKNHMIEKELMHPLCKGSVNIRRYLVEGISKSILFPYEIKEGKAELINQEEFQRNYPKAWKYLNENRKTLEGRERGKWKHKKWYALGRSQNLSEMEQKKILTPSIAKDASFTYDSKGHLYFVGSGGGGGGGYGITLKSSYEFNILYILGLLNSKVLDYCLKAISTTFHGGYYAYNRQYIENLPIRTINLNDPQDKSHHDAIVKLVEQMLEAKEKLSNAKTEAETNRLEMQCQTIDRQIDEVVYQLYGLTAEEIRTVEGK